MVSGAGFRGPGALRRPHPGALAPGRVLAGILAGQAPFSSRPGAVRGSLPGPRTGATKWDPFTRPAIRGVQISVPFPGRQLGAPLCLTPGLPNSPPPCACAMYACPPQVLSVWQWWSYCRAQVPAHKRILNINLDESSVPVWLGGAAGTVVVRDSTGQRIPENRASASLSLKRGAVTLVAWICV